MSHYDEVLKEARAKATGSAAIYIPRLFKILVDEDKHNPEEARAIIEHDLISYWARTTIRKNLPVEAKDEIKAKAGKEGAKATHLVLAGGQTQQTETVTTESDDKMPADDPEEPTEVELLKIENAQLKDAMHKMEQFTQATKLPQEVDIVNNVVVRCGIEKIETLVHNEMSGMRNRGWKTVEITMRAV